MSASQPDVSPLPPPPLALLVDRDDDTRQMYAEYLQLRSWRTDQAIDGAEALAKAFSLRPDVIVTETRLSGISGFDLCTLLRRDPLTKHIVIVVVTGDAFTNDVVRAQNCGADAVLIKPCVPEQLAIEARRLLALARALRTRAMVKRDAAVPLAASTRQRDPLRLICPVCDTPLLFDRSASGGVNPRQLERWDYFRCPAGCGAFQYRVRTRKLRRIS